jgi:hypothetical protein
MDEVVRPGWTCHQHVVSTCGRDLEGSLGLSLSTNGGEIGFGCCPRRRPVADAGKQRSFFA